MLALLMAGGWGVGGWGGGLTERPASRPCLLTVCMRGLRAAMALFRLALAVDGGRFDRFRMRRYSHDAVNPTMRIM